MSLQLPVFDSALQVDTTLDGHTLQAMRIAADDYLDPARAEPPCQFKQESYEYRALRQGKIVFVRIDFKPESCGGEIDMLDAGATYAISMDGRILRRALDGMGPF